MCEFHPRYARGYGLTCKDFSYSKGFDLSSDFEKLFKIRQ